MTKTKLVFIAMALALVAWVGASAASAQDGPSISVDPASVGAAGEHTFTVTGSGWTVAAANVLTCKIPAGSNAAEIDPGAHCAVFANLDLGNLVPAPVTDGGFEVSITINVPEQGIFIVSGDSARTESAQPVLISVAMGDDMGDDMADDMDDDMGDDMADDMDDDMGDDMADDMDDDMGDDMADDMDDDMGDDMADDMDDDMGDDMADDMDDDMGDDMADDMDDDMGDDMADDMDDDMGDDMADDMDNDMGDDMADDMDDDELAETGSNTPLLVLVALSVVLAGAMVLGLSRRLRTQ